MIYNVIITLNKPPLNLKMFEIAFVLVFINPKMNYWDLRSIKFSLYIFGL